MHCAIIIIKHSKERVYETIVIKRIGLAVSISKKIARTA
jgi:hypothetical protein